MLIENWKKALQMSSVQLSLFIIALEAANTLLPDMPEEYATFLRPVLLVMLPAARLVKQTKISG
ncbi:hypothetical protein NVP1285O_59 [Vibrio phage 1.285.O._10N.286.55.C12]|nr:hypothetical protein NVP1285O_59 [Vibrio phage 1.285.O._10N.286.55.C12]